MALQTRFIAGGRLSGGGQLFSATLTKYRTDWPAQVSAFNNLVRDVLYETGQYWIDHFLMMHFEIGAEARYGYIRRSPFWIRLKQSIGELRPLVFTGELLRMVQGGNQRIVAKATQSKQRVVVKVPIPHPLNPKAGKGEIGRLTQSELEEMHAFANKRFMEQIPSRVMLANAQQGGGRQLMATGGRVVTKPLKG